MPAIQIAHMPQSLTRRESITRKNSAQQETIFYETRIQTLLDHRRVAHHYL